MQFWFLHVLYIVFRFIFILIKVKLKNILIFCVCLLIYLVISSVNLCDWIPLYQIIHYLPYMSFGVLISGVIYKLLERINTKYLLFSSLLCFSILSFYVYNCSINNQIVRFTIGKILVLGVFIF
jgi:hypothetical protein